MVGGLLLAIVICAAINCKNSSKRRKKKKKFINQPRYVKKIQKPSPDNLMYLSSATKSSGGMSKIVVPKSSKPLLQNSPSSDEESSGM